MSIRSSYLSQTVRDGAWVGAGAARVGERRKNSRHVAEEEVIAERMLPKGAPKRRSTSRIFSSRMSGTYVVVTRYLLPERENPVVN